MAFKSALLNNAFLVSNCCISLGNVPFGIYMYRCEMSSLGLQYPFLGCTFVPDKNFSWLDHLRLCSVPLHGRSWNWCVLGKGCSCCFVTVHGVKLYYLRIVFTMNNTLTTIHWNWIDNIDMKIKWTNKCLEKGRPAGLQHEARLARCKFLQYQGFPQ